MKKCVGCGLCESSCPIIHKQTIPIKEDTVGYSYINRNDDIRQKAHQVGL